MDDKDPIDVLTRTAIGEADRDGLNAMQGVMNVVVNRANHPDWWGDSILGVCLAPHQFDCWAPGHDRDRIEALDTASRLYRNVRPMAALAVKGLLPDLTRGADSYYSEDGVTPAPSWATQNPEKFTVQIGRERFYRLEIPVERLVATDSTQAPAQTPGPSQAAAIIEADSAAGAPVIADQATTNE